MSHHYSGSRFWVSPSGTRAWTLPICTPFRSRGTLAKSILIMNVHPSVGAQTLPRPLRLTLLRPERYTSSRSTRTVMPLPISRTG
jgi:hypothetical protein